MENMPEEASPYYIWDAGCSLSSPSSSSSSSSYSSFSSSFSSSSSSSSSPSAHWHCQPPAVVLWPGLPPGWEADPWDAATIGINGININPTSQSVSKSLPLANAVIIEVSMTQLPMGQPGLTMTLLLGLLWGRAVMLVVGMKALWGMLLLLLMPLLVLGNPDAKRLYDDLLSNYNRLIRWLLLLLFLLISWKIGDLATFVHSRNLSGFWLSFIPQNKYLAGVWLFWH